MRSWSRLALISVAVATTQAQPLPSPEVSAANQAAERQQREELDRQRERFERDRASARPPTRLEVPAPPAPSLRATATLKREIKTLRLEGATLLSSRFRQKLAAEYEGQALGVADIERLLADLTRYYLERGYVTTRAYLPPQDLSTGELRVVVVEGTIEAIKYTGGEPARDRTGHALPIAPGDILNLRDLEQGIDQLNRLPSNHATLDLAPGSRPGGTVVVIRNDPGRRWRLNFSADNTGTVATGREQVSAGVACDNLLGLSDSLNLYHRRAARYESGKRASEATTLSWSVPWGYNLFTVGGSASSYALLLHPPSGVALSSDGNNRLAFLRAERVIYRNQRSRVSAYTSLTWRSAENYLLGQKLGVSSRDAAIVDAGLNGSLVAAGSVLSADVAASFGMPWLGAAGDADHLPGFAPQAEFAKLTLALSWSRPFEVFGRRFGFTSSLNGAYAPHVLYGSDQISVAGLYAVRGFDETSLAGDAGYVWRNELTTTFAVPVRLASAPGNSLTLSPYLGLDQGRAWTQVRDSRGDLPDEGSVAGATIGLRGALRTFNAELAWSHSLARPAALPRESGIFTVRLGFTY